MPKVSIYLSDELYREAKARDLPLSTLAQDAVERALNVSRSEEWVARVRARAPRLHHPIATAEVLSQVRQEFGE